MTPERVKALLPFLNSKPDAHQHRAGWLTATCPFAPWKHDSGTDHRPSFAVSTATSRKQVYTCFSCQSVGLLDHLPFNLRDLWREDQRTGYEFGKALAIVVADEEDELVFDIPDFDAPIKDPTVIEHWPEFFIDSFKSVFAFPEACDYLESRELTGKESMFLDLRFDTQRKRVCFPIRDYKGGLTGLHGRSIEDDHPMPYYQYGYNGGRNPLVWLGESWVNFDRPVVIAESVFDLASILRVYDNVITPLSIGMSQQKIQRIDYSVQFITVFDHGQGGDQGRAKVDKYMESSAVHLIPSKEYGDAGNMPVEAISHLLSGWIDL